MTHIVKCPTCHILIEDEGFWESHQTMQDGNLWCIRKQVKTVDEMTAAIVSRYKTEVRQRFGNKKRHRQ